MLIILTAILLNAWIVIILKAYPRFKVTAFNAIMVNYFTAGTESFLFAISNGKQISDYQMHWLPWAILCGTMFITLLLVISKSTIANGLAATSVANKMSVVIPALSSIYLFHEGSTFQKYLAIGLALLSVYLATYTSSQSSNNKKTVWMLIFIFIGSGLLDTVVNYCQKSVLSNAADSPLFIGSAFYTGGIIAICISIYKNVKKEFHFTFRDLIGGLCLGIPNFFSIYFIMKAINDKVMESSILFPIINIGVVMTTTIVGLFFFKERLNWINYAGILLSIIAIALLSNLILLPF
jgi:drug/metabolite transporter (DMT)-like permease